MNKIIFCHMLLDSAVRHRLSTDRLFCLEFIKITSLAKILTRCVGYDQAKMQQGGAGSLSHAALIFTCAQQQQKSQTKRYVDRLAKQSTLKINS